jgi:hypothetical protein
VRRHIALSLPFLADLDSPTMLSVVRNRLAHSAFAPALRSVSTWQAVAAGPPDAILGTLRARCFLMTCLSERV